MKSASRVFFLSIFALWASPGACAGTDDCPISPGSIVDDACASYATLELLNTRLKPALDDLTQNTDFFSHYRLNLYNKQCPFWNDEEGMCANIGCAVETLENEEDIPEIWRAQELSKLEGPRAKHPGRSAQRQNPERPLQGKLGESVGESCVFEYDDECDDRDYCVPEDESASSKGDYVSLLRNPERFTGYGGLGAKQVWDAIYSENCFQRSSFPHSADLGSIHLPGAAEHDFKQVLNAAARQQQFGAEQSLEPQALESDGDCLEKRVFYRVVSGMHASISAHLCYNFLNQTTGEWQPNLQCYQARLHDHPDRISNMYFNYALLSRAVAKLGPHLKGREYTFCNDDPSEDEATRAKVLDVAARAASVPQIFDESLMFVNGEGPSLKEDFRNRFRNISRVMDCVGCDKCRLWGKIQTAGYGTALKVLFEFDNDSKDIPVLKRTELVALFNTHARLAESIMAVGRFRDMLSGASDPKPVEVDEDLPADESRTPEPDEMDEDLKEFIRMKRERGRRRSTSDQFKAEFALLFQAMKVVINSWMRAPKAIYNIVTSEMLRLWQFWLGLPVNPRMWKVGLPDLNRPDL